MGVLSDTVLVDSGISVCIVVINQQTACIYASLLLVCYYCLIREGILSWSERRIRGRKVASSNPGRSGGRICSPESTLCADSYSVSFPSPCYHSGT